MSMVYNEMLVKKKQAERMAQKGQNKYEYDSDEETEVILFDCYLSAILNMGITFEVVPNRF